MRERQFPIQGAWHREEHRNIRDSSIPWDLIGPHNRQSLENHAGQDLEKIASRGGFSPDEAVAVIEDRKWTLMGQQEAILRLAELVSEYRAKRKESILDAVFAPLQ